MIRKEYIMVLILIFALSWSYYRSTQNFSALTSTCEFVSKLKSRYQSPTNEIPAVEQEYEKAKAVCERMNLLN